MWDRKVLKARGMRAFRANYWKCVLVAFVLMITVGGSGIGSSFNTTLNLSDDDRNPSQEFYDDYDVNDDSVLDWDDDLDDYQDIDDIPDIPDIPELQTPGVSRGIMGIAFGVLLAIILVAGILGIVFDVLLLKPIEVGCRKFFMDNSEGRGNDVGAMAYAFKTRYGNIVKTSFFRQLYIFLWALLFIIPGIIKALEYRMVPYLLAEDPGMDTKEALETSKKMMYGNKMDAFILDLSFFGWIFLSALTLGILGIFYVNPYIYATEAELYNVLSGKKPGIESLDSYVKCSAAPTNEVEFEFSEDVNVAVDDVDEPVPTEPETTEEPDNNSEITGE